MSTSGLVDHNRSHAAIPTFLQAESTRVQGSISATSCHVVFGFLIASLISLIQLKYQNKTVSPFETQQITIDTFLVMLAIYGSTLVATTISQTRHTTCSKIFGYLSFISGAFCSILLFSILLPRWFIFTLGVLMCLFSTTFILEHIYNQLRRRMMHTILYLWEILASFVIGHRLMEQRIVV